VEPRIGLCEPRSHARGVSLNTKGGFLGGQVSRYLQGAAGAERYRHLTDDGHCSLLRPNYSNIYSLSSCHLQVVNLAPHI
jgi:hypothetical protein